MKEAINTKKKIIGTSFSDVAFTILKQAVVFAVGFLSARGTVLKLLMPFGFAITGGVNTVFSPMAAIGAAVGYISGNGTFRYVASVLAIAAVKLLLGNAFKSELKPIFSAFTVAMVSAATGIVTVKQEVISIVYAATETVIAASGAYFTASSVNAIGKEVKRYTAAELSAFLITLSLIFTGLFPITVADVSVGRVIACAIILLAARYGGAGISAICGTAFGFSQVITGGSTQTLLLLAFGGVVAGVFSPLNKYAVISGFIISAFVSVALIGTVDSLIFIVEAAIGSIIFILMPKNTGAKIGIFLSPVSFENRDGPKNAVTMRLNSAAEALSDVSDTVEQIATELSRINSPDFNYVLKGIENDACRGCALRVHCWETKKSDTLSAVLEMTKAVKSNEKTPEIFAPEEFKCRCVRKDAVGKAVSVRYSDYAAKISAENRIDEVRGVVSDQFSGISDMLKDLSDSINREQVYDNSAANAIAGVLKIMGFRVCDVMCKIDDYGRMTVEAHIKNNDVPINRMDIMKQVSMCCERDFDRPCVETVKDYSIITLCERAVFSADIGVNQISCDGKNMCGDSYNYFYDGRGKLVTVIADGMGTGGRAAVDGAMASGLISRLLKAGFGYDCSLRILNSSMLFKSTDESLSTVDIAVIDLFTGKTDLLKAGAAPTVVRRSGRTGKAESHSLPVGILREIGFDKATIKLKKGDILLMMSDGVFGDNYDWVCEELAAWNNGSAQELSEHISTLAKRRRRGIHDDDITVLAVIMEKVI